MGIWAAIKELMSGSFIGLFLFLEFAVGLLFVAGFRSPKGKRDITSWLSSAKGTRLYETIVGGLLTRIDRALTPENIVDHPRPSRKIWMS